MFFVNDDLTVPRPRRIQCAGANDQVVTRSDGRRKLFHNSGHYERFTQRLEEEVKRSGWLVLAYYCWMMEITAAHHVVDAGGYAAFRSLAARRDMAAWLCRRWTGETLAQLGLRPRIVRCRQCVARRRLSPGSGLVFGFQLLSSRI